MNKIDKRFFYYKTRAAYEEDKDRIPMEATVFIKDPRCILTHGVEYKYEKLEAGEGIQINGNIISSNLDLNNLSEDQIEQIVQQITQIITTNDSSNGVYTKEYIDNLTEELRSEISANALSESDREQIIQQVINAVGASTGDLTIDVNDKILRIYKQNNN